MSSIIKCLDGNCPKKDSCRRWLAPMHPAGPEFQVSVQPPRRDDHCPEYWHFDVVDAEFTEVPRTAVPA